MKARFLEAEQLESGDLDSGMNPRKNEGQRIFYVLAEQRRAQILRVLEAAESITTEQLAEQLQVSGETIRRDLSLLSERSLLQRIHGGAMRATPQPEEAPFSVRAEASAAKRRIGELAASLVSPGQTLVLDVGTTVLACARALPDSFRGTVATCSLLAAAALADRPGVEVLVAGGRVRAGDLALANAQTLEFFADLRADIAILGSGGVSIRGGLTDFYLDEIATRRAIIANSAASYVLADTEKLGRDAPHRVCGISDVTAFITDRARAAIELEAFSKAGGRLLFPADGPAPEANPADGHDLR